MEQKLEYDQEQELILDEKVRSMGYRQPIIDRLDRQTRKGIVEYGDTIDKSGHLRNNTDRLEYLAEELTDALVYIEDYNANMSNIERLFQEVAAERAVYLKELDTVKTILLECIQTKKPIELAPWSNSIALEPLQVSDLARLLAKQYDDDHKKLVRLTAEKIES